MASAEASTEETDDLKPVSFVIIEDGTSQGNPVLISSDGYSYCHKCKGKGNKKNVVVWRCSGSRFKTRAHKDYFQERCKVTLDQVGDTFYALPSEHNHPAKKGWLQHLTFQVTLKRGGLHDTIKSAKELLKDLDIRELRDITRHKDMSSVNRSLASFRYKNKKSEANSWKKFEVDREYLRERTSHAFLRRDKWKKRTRHMIFATDEQLALLSAAKTWHISRNLKVSRLFYQLLTVHVFVHLAEEATLVPALFVMMSHDSKEEYAAVFKAVVEMISPPTKKLRFVIDFNINCGISDALQSLFPTAFISISIFFWWQELKLALSEVGLQKAQLEGRTVHSILRRLFALPLIPASEILVAFDNLCAHIALFPPLEPIAEYIRNSWIDDPQRPVKFWSAFRTPVTNRSAIREWHDSLAALAKKRGHRFYVLIPHLYREAQKMIPLSCNCISDRHMRKILAGDTANFQCPLEGLWNEYFVPVPEKKPKKKKSKVERSKQEQISDRKRYKRKLFVKFSKLLCRIFKFCHT